MQLFRHMNFASRVILAGRSFVSNLLKLAASVKEMYYFVHLNKLCREDLYMWVLFLENWNGVSLFYEKNFTTSHDIFYTLMLLLLRDLQLSMDPVGCFLYGR